MKLTMTFEDLQDGMVSVQCTPSADEILTKVKNWGYKTLTPAEAMMAQAALLLRLGDLARQRKKLDAPNS